jgi:hypothetical protein
MHLLPVGRVTRLSARMSALLCVAVLLCVPALTRITQKLEPVSHTPSFRTNIDCPPKKVVVAPSFAIPSAVLLRADASVRVERLAPPPDLVPPPSPTASAPRPLRAPPSVLPA